MKNKNELQLQIAKRAAEELEDGMVVNLGIGIPLFIPQFLPADKDIFLHTENGMLGVESVSEKVADPQLVNAGKRPIAEKIGASYFDSAVSFAMIRGGHISVAILGALQVDGSGRIANWAIPGKDIIGVGGAMDLLAGAKIIIVTMTHLDKAGNSKIVQECTFPITSNRSVDVIITDQAVFSVKNEELYVEELLNGCSLEQLKQITEASFKISNHLKERVI